MYVQALNAQVLICIQVLTQDWKVQKFKFPESVKTRVVVFCFFFSLMSQHTLS